MAVEKTDLQFYQNTLAKQVIFDGKTASGVKLETSGLRYTLKARKEVVIAAGVVNWSLEFACSCMVASFTDHAACVLSIRHSVSLAATSYGFRRWSS